MDASNTKSSAKTKVLPPAPDSDTLVDSLVNTQLNNHSLGRSDDNNSQGISFVLFDKFVLVCFE